MKPFVPKLPVAGTINAYLHFTRPVLKSSSDRKTLDEITMTDFKGKIGTKKTVLNGEVIFLSLSAWTEISSTLK